MMNAPSARRVRGVALACVKLALGLGAIAWLIARQRGQLAKIEFAAIRGGFLAAAFAVLLSAAVVTFLRWYLLVRGQELPFRIRDALRLGFIGCLFSVVIPGAVGGDLVKATFLAREQARRTVAVATVLLDRIVGLVALFCLAALASPLFWPSIRQLPQLRHLAETTWIAAGASMLGMTVLFSPAPYRWKWLQGMTRWRIVGGSLAELFAAVAVYRQRMGVVLAALAMSLFSHALNVLGFDLAASALPGSTAPLSRMYVVVPLVLFVGAVPITPGGMGTAEGVSHLLYPIIAPTAAPNKGFPAMLLFRLITWAVASVGLFYFVGNQRQIQTLLDQGWTEDRGS